MSVKPPTLRCRGAARRLELSTNGLKAGAQAFMIYKGTIKTLDAEYLMKIGVPGHSSDLFSWFLKPGDQGPLGMMNLLRLHIADDPLQPRLGNSVEDAVALPGESGLGISFIDPAGTARLQQPDNIRHCYARWDGEHQVYMIGGPVDGMRDATEFLSLGSQIGIKLLLPCRLD